MIYFDSAATSLIRPKSVNAAVSYSLKNHAGYARSSHTAAENAANEVFSCRCAAAELFCLAGPENVVFCQNATHALNTAILGLIEKGAAVVSGYEHNAVMRPLYELERQGKTRIIKAASPLFDAGAAINAFERAFDAVQRSGEKCGLCVCTMVSNVFGFILPVGQIGRLCAARGIPFIVDASQAAGSVAVDAGSIGADAICVPGHKGLLGPCGTGMLLLCSDRLPRPFMFGGTGADSKSEFLPELPPDRYECGTQNIAGICGLGAGIRYVLKNREKIFKTETELCAEMARGLSKIRGIKVFYNREDQAGLLSFTAEGTDSELVAQMLAQRGIAVRGGLHCAPCAHETAGTLKTGTVRLSPCLQSTPGQARHVIGEIEKILKG